MEKNHTIYHQLKINASPEQVFDAVTIPEHLIKWWPLKCYGTPKLDAEYNFYFGDPYDWYGQVCAIAQSKEFFIKMTKSDEDWDDTVFGFYLKEEGSATILDFSHSGWHTSNDHFKISSFCWAILLNGLKDYIETGKVIPFEDRN